MRFPDQGSLQWCLGGATPPGPCAQALGRLRSSSDSCPLLEFSPSSAIAHVCLVHPFPLPSLSPFSADCRLALSLETSVKERLLLN